jgi:hypothetical protein
MDETGARHRRLRALQEEPGRVTRLPARRSDNKGRPESGMRVVRVPGGFAYVEDVPGGS